MAGMAEGMLPHISRAGGLAALVLFLAIGPTAVWLGLRVRVPVPDPGASRSVAALVVAPDHWSEPFAGFAAEDVVS